MGMIEPGTMQRLKGAYGHLDGLALLREVLTGELKGRIAVTSSFGAESAVLLDLVAQVDPSTPVIFLDTCELFDETIAYRDTLQKRLGLTNVLVVSPTDDERREAEELWREDVDRCCELRKVRPLARITRAFDALIDGRKRSHGFDRQDLSTIEDGIGVLKISPLANWSSETIEAAFVARDLPRHPLVAQGYRSIGCWPCTSPVTEGDNPRAGRWAGLAKTECGIHTLVYGQDGAGI